MKQRTSAGSIEAAPGMSAAPGRLQVITFHLHEYWGASDFSWLWLLFLMFTYSSVPNNNWVYLLFILQGFLPHQSPLYYQSPSGTINTHWPSSPCQFCNPHPPNTEVTAAPSHPRTCSFIIWPPAFFLPPQNLPGQCQGWLPPLPSPHTHIHTHTHTLVHSQGHGDSGMQWRQKRNQLGFTECHPGSLIWEDNREKHSVPVTSEQS